MDIRQITSPNEIDAGQVSNLLTQLLMQKEPAFQIEKQIECLLRKDDILLVVSMQEEQITGMITGYICPHISPAYSPFLLVEALIVDRAYRRRGIGRRLMLWMERYADQKSCKYITLASQASRNNAHSFYTALGYNNDAAFQKIL